MQRKLSEGNDGVAPAPGAASVAPASADATDAAAAANEASVGGALGGFLSAVGGTCTRPGWSSAAQPTAHAAQVGEVGEAGEARDGIADLAAEIRTRSQASLASSSSAAADGAERSRSAASSEFSVAKFNERASAAMSIASSDAAGLSAAAPAAAAADDATDDAKAMLRRRRLERARSLKAADSCRSLTGHKDRPGREVSARRGGTLVAFGVGDRVRHAEHGEGTVAEKMDDGRTRIAFDSGAEHRYRPAQIAAKLALVRRKSARLPALCAPTEEEEGPGEGEGDESLDAAAAAGGAVASAAACAEASVARASVGGALGDFLGAVGGTCTRPGWSAPEQTAAAAQAQLPGADGAAGEPPEVLLAELSIGAFLHFLQAVGGACSRAGWAPSEALAEPIAEVEGGVDVETGLAVETDETDEPEPACRPAAVGMTRLAQLAGGGCGPLTARTAAVVSKVINLPSAPGLPTPKPTRRQQQQQRERALCAFAPSLPGQQDLARTLFAKYDADGSDSIGVEELRLLCASLGQQLSAEQAEQALARLDADGSGGVSRAEFAAWVAQGLSVVALRAEQQLQSQQQQQEQAGLGAIPEAAAEEKELPQLSPEFEAFLLDTMGTCSLEGWRPHPPSQRVTQGGAIPEESDEAPLPEASFCSFLHAIGGTCSRAGYEEEDKQLQEQRQREAALQAATEAMRKNLARAHGGAIEPVGERASLGAFLRAVGGACSQPGWAPSEPIAEAAVEAEGGGDQETGLPAEVDAEAEPAGRPAASHAPGMTRLAQLAGGAGGPMTQRTQAAVSKVTNLPSAPGLPTPKPTRGQQQQQRERALCACAPSLPGQQHVARSLFARYDADGSDSIGVEEMRLLCASLGHDLSAAQAEQALARLDVDGSGGVSRDEFAAWVAEGLSVLALRAEMQAEMLQQDAAALGAEAEEPLPQLPHDFEAFLLDTMGGTCRLEGGTSHAPLQRLTRGGASPDEPDEASAGGGMLAEQSIGAFLHAVGGSCSRAGYEEEDKQLQEQRQREAALQAATEAMRKNLARAHGGAIEPVGERASLGAFLHAVDGACSRPDFGQPEPVAAPQTEAEVAAPPARRPAQAAPGKTRLAQLAAAPMTQRTQAAVTKVTSLPSAPGLPTPKPAPLQQQQRERALCACAPALPTPKPSPLQQQQRERALCAAAPTLPTPRDRRGSLTKRSRASKQKDAKDAVYV